MGLSPIPRADDKALAYMRAFSSVVSARTSVYGLSPSDVVAIAEVVAKFRVAYDANTRAQSNILLRKTKNVARWQAQRFLLQYYHIIKANNGISDASKIAVGVRPQNPSRTRRHAPGTHPVLAVMAATNGEHIVKYRDTFATGPAKPFAAVALQLFVTVGDDMDRDPQNARLAGNFTRTPMIVAYGHEDDGKKATYFGRWQSARGEVGPWSSAVSFRIAA